MTGKVNMHKSKQFLESDWPMASFAHGLFRPMCGSIVRTRSKGANIRAIKRHVARTSCKHFIRIPPLGLGRKQSLGTSSCRNFTEFAQKLSQTAFLTEDRCCFRGVQNKLPRSPQKPAYSSFRPKIAKVLRPKPTRVCPETCKFSFLTETRPSWPRNLMRLRF